ncbi:hypothetical protein [Chryseobacterium gleum]|uniref:hypothetical protein n=1 Tax=Chryseobacterium gleum TaxID=250 RepID=UPI00241EBC15|nr:hypothetical protein [Chryseobacterium gleum]
MNALILLILIAPYLVSFWLYKRGVKWYKNGVALSILFWVSTGIMGILGDKFNIDISELFFFYYFWMLWVFAGVLIVSIVFWVYNINRTG